MEKEEIYTAKKINWFLKKASKLKIKYIIPVYYIIKKKKYDFKLQISSNKELDHKDFEKTKELNDRMFRRLYMEDFTNKKEGDMIYFCGEYPNEIKGKKVLFCLITGEVEK